MYRMTHYVHRNSDGSVHVTNAIMGMIGQHHVHTESSFKAWEPLGSVEDLGTTRDCKCGLVPGEVKNGPEID